jgi:hypothetical protein
MICFLGTVEFWLPDRFKVLSASRNSICVVPILDSGYTIWFLGTVDF